jgi:CubicO group peptidase (beta-lactamase class C family)
MKKNRLIVFVQFLVLLIAFPDPGVVFPQAPPGLLVKKDPRVIISDLETLVPLLMEKSGVPGLQMALVREGRIIWDKGFGVKNTVTKEPVTGETVFEAASLTKPFFAYVVMKLVEEKVLDLDTPLISYLPREKFENELGHSLDEPDFHKDWLEKITVRHVLSHSSGMPHGEGGKPYPLLFAPGTRYSYSADGYYFLQLAVENLKGEKLETIMKKYALDPLGMKNSSMIWREEYEKTSANGHGYFGSPVDFRKRRQANAAASLYTTAADYARFVCAVLEGKGLKKETLEKMLTPQIPVDEQKGLSWTLGFGRQEDENGPALWQWGDFGISRNYMIAYPQQKIALVYLANSSYGLSICTDLVTHGIGGNSLGNISLDYKSYDYPVYEFIRKVKEQGPNVVPGLIAAMKARYPGDFSRDIIIFLGTLFMEEKLFQGAIALYELNVKENPGSSEDIGLLARAYLEKGDRDQAAAYYRQALEANKDKSFDTTSIDWAMAYIKALEKPVELEENYLKLLAGDYQEHRVEFKGGSLYYTRKGASGDEPVKLVAMSRDTFIIEGFIFIRLRFEFDSQGKPAALVGMYEDGGQDRSTRDK